MENLNLVVVSQESYAKSKIEEECESEPDCAPEYRHSVVKNIPFLVLLALIEDQPSCDTPIYHSFSSVTLEASLVYDNPKGPEFYKPVPFVTKNPVEYTGVEQYDGEMRFMATSVKLSALSSQHGHSSFRIRYEAKLESQSEVLVVYTEPITSVSKPNQIPGYYNNTLTPTTAITTKAASVTTVTTTTTTTPEKKKKRSFNEILTERLESLQQISQEEEQQLELLREIHKNSTTAATATATTTPTLFITECLDPLETAFHALLSAYQMTPAECRPEKVRRIVRKTPSQAIEVWSEIVNLFGSSGMMSIPTLCPHAEELRLLGENMLGL